MNNLLNLNWLIKFDKLKYNIVNLFFYFHTCPPYRAIVLFKESFKVKILYFQKLYVLNNLYSFQNHLLNFLVVVLEIYLDNLGQNLLNFP